MYWDKLNRSQRIKTVMLSLKNTWESILEIWSTLSAAMIGSCYLFRKPKKITYLTIESAVIMLLTPSQQPIEEMLQSRGYYQKSNLNKLMF
jgi:hypothetical protein